jgi:hypothetical protein
MAARGCDVIDIHDYSLTEPSLTGKPFDVDWVLGHDPAFLVTTLIDSSDFPTAYGNERLLLQDARVRERFRSVRTVQQHACRAYVLWARNDVAWP